MASYKLDGIRCIVHPELGPVSRTLKPIPNKYIREMLSHPTFKWFDGELIVGEPTGTGVMQRSNSGVMSRDGSPDFTFYVFDHLEFPEKSFKTRYRYLTEWMFASNPSPDRVRLHEQLDINDHYELASFEENAVAYWYEGLIVRKPDRPYKYGRATWREGGMIKLKRYEDDEATVVGFEVLLRNQNEPTRDKLGHQVRSAHKANKVADDRYLGKLLVEHPTLGAFSIGSGFDYAMRAEIWANQEKYLGRKVTFKYQPYGVKDTARTPIFKAFRDD